VDVVIRPAATTDLAAIRDIFAHYVTTSVATFEERAPTLDDWTRRLAELRSLDLPVLVAALGGTVAGYAYASPWRARPAYRFTVEDSVYVAPGRTGHGIGRQLLASLLEACLAAGRRQVVAVVADTGDPASEALHRGQGFEVAGRLRAVGWKHGRWVDTTIMQRSLVDS